MTTPSLRPPRPTIWLQILGIVAGALIAAQVVTLVLTLLLPPAPPQQHSLVNIADALRGKVGAPDWGRPLIRTAETAPPSLDSPGWVVSPSTTSELAKLLGAPEADVRILFYAPPPLAGTAPPPPRGPPPGGMNGPGPMGGPMGGMAPPPAPPGPVLAGRPLAIPVIPSMFGFTRPGSFIEGDFVAAVRSPAGWVTVQPKPEGFPNAWQRRVLLWFLLSFALVAPPAYLMSRRLVVPLQRFADSAAQLGRDPTADLPPLTGPAEVGRAANAFNLMGLRLRRYVDDRTGMISAITHDLRTPLSRIRFKMERAAPALRASLTRDVEQMEAMISSVLSFMRDGLGDSPRQFADIRSIVECVVDEAGDRAELAAGPPVNGHVDLLGLQRVFENLVSNAIKYGGRARVQMRTEREELIVEVADDGPGVPPEELENVFRPFYRTLQARNSGAPGVGLGLAVSRSILRAHGGDLTLVSTDHGLVISARIPLAGAVLRAA
jgi:two-component system OmpR family sensor kinase